MDSLGKPLLRSRGQAVQATPDLPYRTIYPLPTNRTNNRARQQDKTGDRKRVRTLSTVPALPLRGETLVRSGPRRRRLGGPWEVKCPTPKEVVVAPLKRKGKKALKGPFVSVK